MLERPLPAQLVGIDHQQDYHNTELQINHGQLRDAYRQLAQVEYKLANRSTLGIQRKEKKKLQWAKATMKRKVQNLEDQSAGMREQVFAPHNNMMIETGPLTAMSLASYPFTPSPYGMPATPLWPLQSAHWPTPGPYQLPAAYTGGSSWLQGQPQYVDSDGSTNWPHPMAAEEPASGFTDHVSAHEVESAAPMCSRWESPENLSAPVQGVSKTDEDELATIASQHSPSGLSDRGNITSNAHKRRYSEAAVQLIEGRLTDSVNGTSCHRKRRSMYVRPIGDDDVAEH